MHQYDPTLARLLSEVAQTPTGWPLIDWVQLHWPVIEYGEPPPGLGAFCYPWPVARVIIKNAWSEDWQRKTLAHELVHMIRWRGHLVGSLEQEYDAYRTEAQVHCEWHGWNWMEPDAKAIENYPLFFGPAASRDEFMRQLPSRAQFYAILPWNQPRTPLGIARAMAQQGLFGLKGMLGIGTQVAAPKQASKKSR